MTQNENKEFSEYDKFQYYLSRIHNKKLTFGQREYAKKYLSKYNEEFGYDLTELDEKTVLGMQNPTNQRDNVSLLKKLLSMKRKLAIKLNMYNASAVECIKYFDSDESQEKDEFNTYYQEKALKATELFKTYSAEQTEYEELLASYKSTEVEENLKWLIRNKFGVYK